MARTCLITCFTYLLQTKLFLLRVFPRFFSCCRVLIYLSPCDGQRRDDLLTAHKKTSWIKTWLTDERASERSGERSRVEESQKIKEFPLIASRLSLVVYRPARGPHRKEKKNAARREERSDRRPVICLCLLPGPHHSYPPCCIIVCPRQRLWEYRWHFMRSSTQPPERFTHSTYYFFLSPFSLSVFIPYTLCSLCASMTTS